MIIGLAFAALPFVPLWPIARPQAGQAAVDQSNKSAQVRTLTASTARAYGTNAKGIWKLSGSVEMHGIHDTFTLVFDDAGRYVMQIVGPDAETDGFDGEIAWTVGASRIPQVSYGTGITFGQLEADMISGAWTNPERAKRYQLVTGSGKNASLNLNSPDQGKLTIDPVTQMPSTLSIWSGSGGATWTFSSCATVGKRSFPTEFSLKDGPETEHWKTSASEQIKRPFNFKMPPAKQPIATYDRSASTTVAVKRIGGYMFVEPKIDGQDAGWFFLDSGSGGMCINPDTAAKLHLPTVTKVSTVGVVGSSWNPVVQSKSFSLGPVSFDQVNFTEVPELKEFSNIFKIPIAGICGTDFIARARITIDPTKNTIDVAPPSDRADSAQTGSDHADDHGIHWTPVTFFQGVPAAEFNFCAFAPGSTPAKATFTVDTGSGSTVDFCAPAVNRYALTDGQQTNTATTGGVGGSAKSGLVKAAWFNIGGVKVESPTIGVQYAKTGLFSCPYLGGNIGEEFLTKFILTLDYTHNRIGFTPLKQTAGK